MAATQRALSNDDLLLAIFEHVDSYETIGHARLTSKAIETAASPFLFSTLRLGFRKRYLRRLKWVAARKKFARGHNSGNSRELNAGLARLKALGKDEEELSYGVRLYPELAKAFQSLTGLKRAAVTGWSSGQQRMFYDQ
ncbi:hypothetical protein LTR36_001521 [Oleoguttula mirabilis]|uniref:F-box domain-containing protein n=1 Tax=Oleoguttula mirabilis TaxID=1507867 RepID=A0AAV9JN34_9PEZI|nr:hypothetical protein LTR36_001521 [Oleoguttula mirabilis]